jgi:hypothetical protein
VPASWVTPVAAPQTAPSPPAAPGPLRRPYGRKFPDYRGRPFPLFHPWGGPPAHPGYRAGLSMWRSAEQPHF